MQDFMGAPEKHMNSGAILAIQHFLFLKSGW